MTSSAPAVRMASTIVVVVDLAPRAEQQVVAQGRGEEQRLLGHHADGLAELSGVEVGERDAVERGLARIGIDEPRRDAGERGLAATRAAR